MLVKAPRVWYLIINAIVAGCGLVRSGYIQAEAALPNPLSISQLLWE